VTTGHRMNQSMKIVKMVVLLIEIGMEIQIVVLIVNLTLILKTIAAQLLI
jgi:hypothetical protein